MATRVLPQTFEPNWSWPRISGLSGSFGLHVAALLLLALPVAIPTSSPEPVVISATVHEKPSELAVSPIPPEPQPQQMPRRQEQPVVTARPVVVESSVMAIPIIAPATEITVPATFPNLAAVAPAIASNASLAYESIIEPSYPLYSRRHREEGTVILRVHVGRDGMPMDIDISRSSGFRQLDRAAREAVMRWRFRPVQIDGVNVEAFGLVPIKFDLGRG